MENRQSEGRNRNVESKEQQKEDGAEKEYLLQGLHGQQSVSLYSTRLDLSKELKDQLLI